MPTAAAQRRGAGSRTPGAPAAAVHFPHAVAQLRPASARSALPARHRDPTDLGAGLCVRASTAACGSDRTPVTRRLRSRAVVPWAHRRDRGRQHRRHRDGVPVGGRVEPITAEQPCGSLTRTGARAGRRATPYDRRPRRPRSSARRPAGGSSRGPASAAAAGSGGWRRGPGTCRRPPRHRRHAGAYGVGEVAHGRCPVAIVGDVVGADQDDGEVGRLLEGRRPPAGPARPTWRRRRRDVQRRPAGAGAGRCRWRAARPASRAAAYAEAGGGRVAEHDEPERPAGEALTVTPVAPRRRCLGERNDPFGHLDLAEQDADRDDTGRDEQRRRRTRQPSGSCRRLGIDGGSSSLRCSLPSPGNVANEPVRVRSRLARSNGTDHEAYRSVHRAVASVDGGAPRRTRPGRPGRRACPAWPGRACGESTTARRGS